MDLQPTLKGELLTLRPLLAEDWAALYRVASDPLLWEQHPEANRYKQEVFSLFFQKALDSQGALVAVDAATKSIIGSSRFYDYDPVAREVCIGYTFFARSHWQRGYNREGKRLMLAHAFANVDAVFFQIGENNRRSRAAIEKIGAHLVDRAASAASVIYTIRKENYKSELRPYSISASAQLP